MKLFRKSLAAALRLVALLILGCSFARADSVTQAWVQRFGGTGDSGDAARYVMTDSGGNVIVVGSTSDGNTNGWLIIKYSNAGAVLWTNRLNGPDYGPQPRAAAVDTNGNVIVAGIADWLGANQDLLVAKYSSAGVLLWTNRYNGPANSAEEARAVGVDSVGNVIVTGASSNGTNNDYATIKYSTNGVALWTNRYNGGFGNDIPAALAVDGSGNVIVTGSSVTSGGDQDFLTIKYTAAGAVSWTKATDGASGGDADYASAIAVDATGNVFVTGNSWNGTTSLDFMTIRYNSGGVFSWNRRYNATTTNYAQSTAIAVDASGNVFVTGSSSIGTNLYLTDYATIKYPNGAAGAAFWTNRFNGPVNGSDTPTALAVVGGTNVIVTGYSHNGTNYDYAIIKYSGAGAGQWTNRYHGPGIFLGGNGDFAYDVATDSSGNAFVTGYSLGVSGAQDFATLKYATNGVALWTNRFSGVVNSYDTAYAVVVDSSGNVFTAGQAGNGTNADFATIKYSDAGTPLWTNSFNGPRNGQDTPRAAVLDASGNVIVTGSSYGNGISDPDYATVKYSNAGVPVWTNLYNGPGNSNDVVRAIAADSSGNVIVTGYSFVNSTNLDYATIKYSSAGVPLWTNRFNGPANYYDTAAGVAVDTNDNVFVTGYSYLTLTNATYTTIKYSSAGVPVWTNRYTGSTNASSSASASAIAVDAEGNVIVTGTTALGANSGDYATIKYSNAGVALWTNTYDGPLQFIFGYDAYDTPSAIKVDANGNVFVTGSSANQFISSSVFYSTVAYSSAGALLWTNVYFGGYAYALAVDGRGNVLVTGYQSSTNGATIAYSNAGTPLWTNIHSAPTSGVAQPTSLAVGSNGTLFVAGTSEGDMATAKFLYTVPPLITGQPASRTNVADTTATFSVTVTGSAPLAYQWRHDGTNVLNGGNVSGATTNLLTLSNVTFSAAGNYTVIVTNVGGGATSEVATLTVICPTITVSPASFPAGEVGAAYDQTNVASGGAAPYSFAVTSGSLPPGLSLSSSGVLSGTPTNNGDFNFTVTATDANSCTGVRSYSLNIACPTITVGPATLPDGTSGVSYHQTNTASGGTAPDSFAVIAGSLPPGLSLSSSGVLSGTPTNGGNFGFTVQATDAYGCAGSRAYALTIVLPPPISNVLPLPPLAGPWIPVQWMGQAAPGGNPPANYDIYLSTNGTSYSVWLTNTTSLSAGYRGAPGQTYYFYSIARDGAGREELAPPVADAQTTVPTNAPVLAAVPDANINPGQILALTNSLISGTPVGEYVFSLDPVAPDGATVTASNGVFNWTPTCAQASTTNVLTARVTDSGQTNLTDAVTFTVTVRECVSPQLGRLVIATGDSGRVPINLVSSVQLTNLTMRVLLPEGRLANPSVETIVPELCGSSVDFITNGQYSLTFTTCSNQWLIGTQQVAWLNFIAVSNQSSAFVRLDLDQITGHQPDGTPVANFAPQSGRVVIVGVQPLLEAILETNRQVTVILYAAVNSTNQVDSTSALAAPTAWSPWTQLVMTNLFRNLPVPASTNRSQLFRAVRQ